MARRRARKSAKKTSSRGSTRSAATVAAADTDDGDTSVVTTESTKVMTDEREDLEEGVEEEQPMVTRCPHVDTCRGLTHTALMKAKMKAECDDCGVLDGWRWLCLTDSCGRVLCGSKTNNHSDLHYQENSAHSMQLNMRSGRVWCQSCDCEIVPRANIPPFASSVERVLLSRAATKEEGSVIAPSEENEQMDTSEGIEEVSDDNTVVLPVSSQENTLVDRPPRLTCLKPTQGRLFNDRGETRVPTMCDLEEDGDCAYPRGLTGLCNLGNTCYMNAAVQALSNCAPLSDFFRSCSSVAPFGSQIDVSAHSVEPPVARSFRILLHAIWSPTRSGCTNPQLLLRQIRTRCPQFRGWGQQDSQEFIRCFLDLLHHELRQPVFPWEYRDVSPPRSSSSMDSRVRLSSCSSSSSFHSLPASTSTSGAACSETDSVAAQRRNSSSSSSSRSSSSNGADRYETADSGWSSDGDAPYGHGSAGVSSSVRARKRCRSDSPGTLLGSGTVAGRSTRESSSISPVTVGRTRSCTDLKDFVVERSREAPHTYRSIVSEVFDGKVRSTVKCLTCHHLSETHETFQDLSLSIPTKEQLERIAAASFVRDEANCGEFRKEQEHLLGSTETSSPGWQWLWWLGGGWLRALYGYFFGGAVSLCDALSAFFSPDDLRGENMYSCEKCAKLRNGVKMCKITRLPEVLCIHLKRFRHDSSYSSKVSREVTFPLCDLDMSPFVSRSLLCNDKRTLYDLCAFITHHGSSAESGHYLAYCKNEIDNQWYEFDDAVVTRLEPADVLSKEAYVLFYQKREFSDMQRVRDRLRELLERENEERNKLRCSPHYYISREWLHRLSTFSNPGPITNHDFLCQHAQILPRRAPELAEYYASLSAAAWKFLHEKFGGGPECTELHYCARCQGEYHWLRHKRESELKLFKSIEGRVKEASRCYPALTYGYYLPPNAISKTWLITWRAFVDGEQLVPPGAIDNSLLLVGNSKESTLHFRRSSYHVEIPRELWLFFASVYGGGPEVFCTSEVHPSVEEIREMVARVDAKIADAVEELKASCAADNSVDDTQTVTDTLHEPQSIGSSSLSADTPMVDDDVVVDAPKRATDVTEIGDNVDETNA